MNKARALLTKHVNRLIAEGQPVIVGIPADDYEARVSAIEAEGVCRSDAQAIVDAQLLKEVTA